MTDERAFNLSGADAMAGHVHHIVGTAHDHEVPVGVLDSHVASEITAGNSAPVAFVTLRIPIDRAEKVRSGIPAGGGYHDGASGHCPGVSGGVGARAESDQHHPGHRPGHCARRFPRSTWDSPVHQAEYLSW